MKNETIQNLWGKERGDKTILPKVILQRKSIVISFPMLFRRTTFQKWSSTPLIETDKKNNKFRYSRQWQIIKWKRTGKLKKITKAKSYHCSLRDPIWICQIIFPQNFFANHFLDIFCQFFSLIDRKSSCCADIKFIKFLIFAHIFGYIWNTGLELQNLLINHRVHNMFSCLSNIVKCQWISQDNRVNQVCWISSVKKI